MSQKAWLSKELKNGKILCEACSQACVLSEGEYGICSVRKVENGELKLLVYGIAAAVNVDPVEKKPMFHFYQKAGHFQWEQLDVISLASFVKTMISLNTQKSITVR